MNSKDDNTQLDDITQINDETLIQDVEFDLDTKTSFDGVNKTDLFVKEIEDNSRGISEQLYIHNPVNDLIQKYNVMDFVEFYT